MDQVADVLIEIIDLVNAADSGTISSAEQQTVAMEVRFLLEQIDNILSSGVAASIFTGFNVGKLLNARVSGGVPSLTTLNIQTGQIIVTGTATDFASSLTNLSSALNSILGAEETLGSYIHRLEFELDDLSANEVADRSSLSTLIDADLAEEQVNLSSLQILQQTSLVGLIQANTSPSAILGLIQ